MNVHPEFTLHDLLRNSVERYPDKVAIVEGKNDYTYADLRIPATPCARRSWTKE